ncbi:MAG: DEAD/DEAH box helicase [Deltaproteobacteria bacterium]|nr:DEAD/DEAH box helicase [Deltaproteobacteria bacterium]
MTSSSASTNGNQETPLTFDALPLSIEVRKAVDEIGWQQPTPVQVAAFNLIAEGSDLVVQAQTGTGKTAAFGLPLIDKRIRPDGGLQALILTPTRELALQIKEEFERLGRYRKIKTLAIYGGSSFEQQAKELAEGAHIVSGTPGRVLDHIRRGTLKTEGIRVLVLDEADEMLAMGFARDLRAIVKELPRHRQNLLFSATIDDSIQRIASQVLKDPIFLSLSSDGVGAQSIAHYIYLVSGFDKVRDLIRIIEVEDPESAIIFCNTKATTEYVAAELRSAGFNADWLNGDLPQSERERVLELTRRGVLRFLVATDLAARGIDISHITHVINYDFPDALENYIHRTGRTGRAGRTGTAISLVTPIDLGQLYYLRLQYKIFPLERTLPTEGELRARRELDRIEMLRAAFSRPGSVRDSMRSLARRLLVHDEAEFIVAGLLESFLGTLGSEEEVDLQAARARRSRLAPSQDELISQASKVDEVPSEEKTLVGEAGVSSESGPFNEPSKRRKRKRERGELQSESEQERNEVTSAAEGPSTEQRSESGGTLSSTEGLAESDESAYASIFLNVGRRDGVRISDFLRLFEQRVGLRRDQIGRIRIRDRHSFVSVPRERINEVLSSLVGVRFGEKELIAEIARSDRIGVEAVEP